METAGPVFEDPAEVAEARSTADPGTTCAHCFELAEDSAAELDSYIDAGRVLVAASGSDVIGHLQPRPPPDTRPAFASTASNYGTGYGWTGRYIMPDGIQHAKAGDAVTCRV